MKTIHKFPLRISDTQRINVQMPARIVSAGLDPSGELCIWAEVDTEAPTETKVVHIVGTGQPLPPEPREFIGTVRYGARNQFMWHIYVS